MTNWRRTSHFWPQWDQGPAVIWMWPLCNVSTLQRSRYFQPLPGRSGRKRIAGESQAPALHWEPVAARGSGRKAARVLPKPADGVQPHRCQRAPGKPAESLPLLSPSPWSQSPGVWIQVGSMAQANRCCRQMCICEMFFSLGVFYLGINCHFTRGKGAEIIRAAIAKDGEERVESNEIFDRYLNVFPALAIAVVAFAMSTF